MRKTRVKCFNSNKELESFAIFRSFVYDDLLVFFFVPRKISSVLENRVSEEKMANQFVYFLCGKRTHWSLIINCYTVLDKEKNDFFFYKRKQVLLRYF